MSFDALLLTSFGGPEALEEVMPFLERVVQGRGVPKERLMEVAHHYEAFGGVSPINGQNRELLAALKDELRLRAIDLPIYLGNRNSAPYFSDVLLDMYADGHRNVLALVTSAYSSYSGCRQYRENLAEALVDAGLVGKLMVSKIRNYFDHPGFIDPFVTGTRSAVSNLVADGIDIEQIQVLFTTHSIPKSAAESSGPASRRAEFPQGAYVSQHEAVSTLVMSAAFGALTGLEWELVYQSRSGPAHVPWLEPDILDALKGVSDAGKRAVVVVPIGFVSDHIEVVWDLDDGAKNLAEALGLRFSRVATPGVQPSFVRGLVSLIEERINQASVEALSPIGPWPQFCASDCCPNPRAELAVID